MTKLIKLSETRYVIVDDSEIQEGDWCIYFKQDMNDLLDVTSMFKTEKIELDSANRLSVVCGEGIYVYVKDCKKITHSTEPLEHDEDGGWYPDSVKALHLSEVEEIINGYNFNKIASGIVHNNLNEIESSRMQRLYIAGIRQGFKAHQALVTDKLFTLEDIKLAFNNGVAQAKAGNMDCEDYIQSLLLTEWEIDTTKTKL